MCLRERPPETGLRRLVGLGREPVPRRPASRIRGVWTARYDEVWVEALKLLIDLGKPADGYLYVRTEITQDSIQRVGVDAVGFFVGDQDPHVAFSS